MTFSELYDEYERRAELESTAALDITDKLIEYGIHDDEKFVSDACDLIDVFDPYYARRSAREYGDRSGIARVKTAWTNLNEAFEKLSPVESTLILEGLLERGARDAWERGADAMGATLHDALTKMEARKLRGSRPRNPETYLLVAMGRELLEFGTRRKDAARWLSWYAEHFWEIKRSVGAVDQLLRNRID